MKVDVMATFPESWSDIVGEMLPLSDCDVCGPPLDIGPPPPLPANFQERADLSGNCNVCHMLSDVDVRPAQLAEASVLPVILTLVVGISLMVVTLTVLLVKIKKCRSVVPHVFCWVFPRNLLPHTELAPSSLPSPSPSTEKLKAGKHPWHGSSRSLQSENIYEVCSPPSQDSLYEEVGPPPVMTPECTPYGVVLVEKSSVVGIVPGIVENRGFGSGSWLAAGSIYSKELQKPKASYLGAMSVPHFSTFGGNSHGFFNSAMHEAVKGGTSFSAGTSETLGPNYYPKRKPNLNTSAALHQKRQLPPVPHNSTNFQC